MNFSSTATGADWGQQKRGLKSPLTYNGKVYKSASDALEAYIEHFERKTPLYRRKPSELLSPQAKYYYMDSLERSLTGAKSPAKKVDDLLNWVNETYAKNLSSRVEPFGLRTTPELPGSVIRHSRGQSRMIPTSASKHQTFSSEDTILSNLPSPSSSVVDLDSNAESDATDILLSSYKGPRPVEQAYSKSNLHRPTPHSSSKSLSTSSKNRSRPDGSTEYPSWVSSLGKEYPSWVEELDTTAQNLRRSPYGQSPNRYLSGSSKPDAANRSSSSSSPSLKISDLYRKTTSPGTNKGKSKSLYTPPKAAVDWSDSASVDTEVLLSQPIYGVQPVNMGGNLHKSLHEDKKILRLKKENTKKLRKSPEKSSKTVTFSERKSRKDTPRRYYGDDFPNAYTNEALHSSTREDPRSESPVHKYKDLSPLRSTDISPHPVEKLIPKPQYSLYSDGQLHDTSIIDSSELPITQKYPGPFSSTLERTKSSYGKVREVNEPLHFHLQKSQSPYTNPERFEKSFISEGRPHTALKVNTQSHLISNESEKPLRRKQHPFYLTPDKAASSSRKQLDSPYTTPDNTTLSTKKQFSSPYTTPGNTTSSSKYKQHTSRFVKTANPSYTPQRTSFSKSSKYTPPRNVNISSGKDESDIDSMDTDKVLRQSPTGIRMRKIPRDPSSIYPTKGSWDARDVSNMYPTKGSLDARDVSNMYPTKGSLDARDDSSIYPTKGAWEARDDNRIYTSPKSHIKAEKSFEKPNVHSTPIYGMELAARYQSPSTNSESFQKENGRSMDDQFKAIDLDRSSDVRATSPYRSKFMYPVREIKASPKITQKPPHAPQGSLSRGRHRRSKTMPDLRRSALHKRSSTKHLGRSFDDDLLTYTTDDTESLVTRPSMPLVDASPSLTTVSDSDTMVGSDTETEHEGYTNKRTVLTPFKSGTGLSPTSVFASSNPNAAVREQPPGKYHLWEMNEDMKAPTPTTKEKLKERLANGKPQIISSFLKDCLEADEVTEEEISRMKMQSDREARLSGRGKESGPVEALKQMLFTMQDMAHRDNGDGKDDAHEHFFSAAKFVRDESSDEQSERSSEILKGEASLQRAYRHLERLKRLVGSEDDRSSVSSAV